MDKCLCDYLVKWLQTFPEYANVTSGSLSDGVILGDILHQIAPEYFSNQWKSKILTNVGDNWRLKMSNLRKIHQGIMDYLSEFPGHTISQFPKPDLNKIGEHGDEIELGRLLQLILGCAINCEQKQKHIEAIMKMEEGVQANIVNAIQDLMSRESSPGVPDVNGGSGGSSGPWFGPASFHPHMKTLVEQLESTSLAKDDMTRRCNELDLQVSLLNEEKETLKKENAKLEERIEALESGEDVGAQSFRYKEIRKQVDTLQDELYKLESSRDEYRSRVEVLERENKEITAKNEELQILAEEARSLKDEVDALKDMSDRVAVYEGTVETLKKRMEELSDLKRQVKKLEEKNSEYMQINMDLEEEVKKSGALRPQLDLYKKQVSDLHQKLSDEEKKTDRQIFDNKKLNEKLEAVTQEKERLTAERDLLKENFEELKCTVSALNSPENALKAQSDWPDIDTLEIIPPEIREKLIRLQHENRVLKQKAETKPDVSAPMLQSLLNDLQERHDKLLQENRWGGDRFCPPAQFSPHWPSSGRTRSSSQSPIDVYFMLDTTRKLKLLKRNLKWASDSDLLILRQHGNIFPSSFSSSMNHRSLKKTYTLPSSSVAPTVSNNHYKENPIVIRHIHEFKMPPSPTNDDSGCCRTSPSSCEGCEDQHPSGSFGIHTPDFGGTLDSGLSGMYRCVSPVIPSVVEECTTQHMSDILPALLNQDASMPSVMYHSHPTHGANYYSCCSSKPLSSEVVDASCKRTISTHTQTTCFCLQNSNPLTSFRNNPGNPATAKENQSSTEQNNFISGSANCPPHEVYNVSQSRKLVSTLPKRLDPPDSPTPHNSPRLPHSIHSNRSKKLSPQRQIHSFINDLPLTQRATVSREPYEVRSRMEDKMLPQSAVQICNDRSQSQCSDVPNISEIEIHKTKRTELKLSQRDLIKLPDLYEAQQDKSSENCEVNISILHLEPKTPEKIRTNFANRLRSKTPEKFKSISEKFRASFRDSSLEKSPDKDKNKPFGRIRSRSLDKYRAKVSAKLKLHSPFTENQLNNDNSNVMPTDNLKVSSCPQVNCASPTNYEVILSSDNHQRCDDNPVDVNKPPTELGNLLNKTNGPTADYNMRSNDLRRSRFDSLGLPPYSSLRIKKQSTQYTNQPSCQTKLYETVNAANGPGSVTAAVVTRPQNNIRNLYNHIFSQNTNLLDAGIQRMQPNSSSTKVKKSPASLDNINSTPCKRGYFRTPAKTKSADITLLTDTMFTHFVVSHKGSEDLVRLKDKKYHSSPPSLASLNSVGVTTQNSRSHRYSKDSEPLLSDAETDIEVMESKLVSSSFGAPLVSSESSFSFHQSDQTDNDPSATDYTTDYNSEMDFNPQQYKINGTKSLSVTNFDDTNYSDVNGDSHPLTSYKSLLIAKRNHVAATKMKNPLGLNSKAIVKVKNKTAKAVVAETFNAMFTFCTP